jgi:hypothetical protein
MGHPPFENVPLSTDSEKEEAAAFFLSWLNNRHGNEKT